MKKIITIIFLSFLFPTLTSAADKFCNTDSPHPIDVWYEKEMDKTEGVTVKIRNIQSTAYEKWDKELNLIYKELIKKLKEEDKKILRESQRNWIKFRDSEIKFWWSSAMYGGGTGNLATIIVSDKGRNLLKQRVCDLTNYYDSAYNIDY